MDGAATERMGSPALLGIGLYTVSEAARLTEIPALRIRRWLAGCRYGADGWSEPLWTPQLPRIDGEVALGFRDLMELQLVAAFLTVGISLRIIRRALEVGRDVVGDERPFSTMRFHTDGRSIFMRVAAEAPEPVLIDLLRKQYAFYRALLAAISLLMAATGYSTIMAIRPVSGSCSIRPRKPGFGGPAGSRPWSSCRPKSLCRK